MSLFAKTETLSCRSWIVWRSTGTNAPYGSKSCRWNHQKNLYEDRSVPLQALANYKEVSTCAEFYSDHRLMRVVSAYHIPKANHKEVRYSLWDEANTREFERNIWNVTQPYELLRPSLDLSGGFETFVRAIENVIEHYFPVHMKRVCQKSDPWVSSALRTLIWQRDQKYKNMKLAGNKDWPILHSEFKALKIEYDTRSQRPDEACSFENGTTNENYGRHLVSN